MPQISHCQQTHPRRERETKKKARGGWSAVECEDRSVARDGDRLLTVALARFGEGDPDALTFRYRANHRSVSGAPPDRHLRSRSLVVFEVADLVLIPGRWLVEQPRDFALDGGPLVVGIDPGYVDRNGGIVGPFFQDREYRPPAWLRTRSF